MIEATGISKHFGENRALDGFDLDVARGTICGLLGPNGAGKTTAVRVLTTLLRADAGTARVAGFDVAAQPGCVRGRIGLSGQGCAIDEVLTGRQNLVLFARLSGCSRRHAARRAGEMLERFGLIDAADRPTSTYSGGMQRRIDLAVTLLQSPAVLFLDEPTAGLDPPTRLETWDMVRALARDGATVLLTTQDLAEADRLADQVVLMRDGRVAMSGTATELTSRLNIDRLEITFPDRISLDRAASIVADRGLGDTRVEPHGHRITTRVDHDLATVGRLAAALDAAGLSTIDFALRRPTLEDVFMSLNAPTENRP